MTPTVRTGVAKGSKTNGPGQEATAMTTKMDRLMHSHLRGSVWSATGHHVSLAWAAETPEGTGNRCPRSPGKPRFKGVSLPESYRGQGR